MFCGGVLYLYLKFNAVELVHDREIEFFVRSPTRFNFLEIGRSTGVLIYNEVDGLNHRFYDLVNFFSKCLCTKNFSLNDSMEPSWNLVAIKRTFLILLRVCDIVHNEDEKSHSDHTLQMYIKEEIERVKNDIKTPIYGLHDDESRELPHGMILYRCN
ncbi:hypothetical protein RF11_03306 [Thelohanellus kitauei]|uniref:Uncharacterized protein n=1 Tax=Thelohanellus kitauei TaxID=669202 RepID=A0A0C2MWB3_THEKT|nr:hypothetical protein RF11_03306 [Thelohanellus kitauei]